MCAVVNLSAIPTAICSLAQVVLLFQHHDALSKRPGHPAAADQNGSDIYLNAMLSGCLYFYVQRAQAPA